MNPHAGDAASIVLCGGQSTRMGSSKPFLPFGRETMLQRVVRLVGMATAPVIVVAAAGQALPALPSSVVVARDVLDDRGPLEGLRAGLASLPGTVLAAYVTGCDAPLIVPAFVRRMIELLEGYDIAVMEVNGVLHPLAAVYRRRILPRVEALLGNGGSGPLVLCETARSRRVQPAEVAVQDSLLESLRNVNTQEDYRDALACAGLAAAK